MSMYSAENFPLIEYDHVLRMPNDDKNARLIKDTKTILKTCEKKNNNYSLICMFHKNPYFRLADKIG